MKADELDDFLDLITDGEVFKPHPPLIVGFDNHMFPNVSITMGKNLPDAYPGQISWQGREGLVVTLTRAGIVTNGELLDDEACVALFERLFPVPDAYELRTTDQVSFKVTKTGDVFVNGRKIGRSRKLLPAMLSHLLLEIYPLARQWQTQIQTPSKKRSKVSCKK